MLTNEALKRGADKEDRAAARLISSIVLSGRRHGESSAIVDSRPAAMAVTSAWWASGGGPYYNNRATASWRARLDEHLGYYMVEGTRLELRGRGRSDARDGFIDAVSRHRAKDSSASYSNASIGRPCDPSTRRLHRG